MFLLKPMPKSDPIAAAAGEFLQNKLAVLSSLAALFVLQAIFRFQSDLNHDTAWYLHVAAGLLDGKRLYSDFIEVNPPLGIWLMVPVAGAARLTGADAIHLLYLSFFALTAASLGLAARYLNKLPGLASLQRNALLIAIAILLLFVPAGDFAQREHLQVLLFLPWLFLRLVRSANVAIPPFEAVITGTIAAIGICLKPHSLVAPIFVELAILILSRNPRLVIAPENLAAVGFAALYVVVLGVAVPEFFSGMIGLGLRAYVPFYGFGSGIIFLGSTLSLALAIAASALLPLVRGPSRNLTIVCLAASAGLLASYYLQAKGYSYQALPAKILSSIALSAALLGSLNAMAGKAGKFAALAGATVLFVVVSLWIDKQFYGYQGSDFTRAIAKYRPQAKSFFIASTNVTAGFPLTLKGNLVWASRFPAQWLAPYVAAHWQGGLLPADPIVAFALDAMVSDLEDFRPDIVFIDIRQDLSYYTGRPLDYVKFWENDSRFAAIWRDYQFQNVPGDYAIYVRKAK